MGGTGTLTPACRKLHCPTLTCRMLPRGHSSLVTSGPSCRPWEFSVLVTHCHLGSSLSLLQQGWWAKNLHFEHEAAADPCIFKCRMARAFSGQWCPWSLDGGGHLCVCFPYTCAHTRTHTACRCRCMHTNPCAHRRMGHCPTGLTVNSRGVGGNLESGRTGPWRG